jgi:hypothetical protein
MGNVGMIGVFLLLLFFPKKIIIWKGRRKRERERQRLRQREATQKEPETDACSCFLKLAFSKK